MFFSSALAAWSHFPTTFFFSLSSLHHVATSRCAEKHIFSPLRLLKIPLCRSRSRCLTWTATGQWMLQNSVSSPTLWDRTVLLAVGTGNSVSQFGFCFLLESDSSFYLSSLFPAQTNLLALSCFFFVPFCSFRNVVRSLYTTTQEAKVFIIIAGTTVLLAPSKESTLASTPISLETI